MELFLGTTLHIFFLLGQLNKKIILLPKVEMFDSNHPNVLFFPSGTSVRILLLGIMIDSLVKCGTYNVDVFYGIAIVAFLALLLGSSGLYPLIHLC